jgi:hypothetical protein
MDQVTTDAGYAIDAGATAVLTILPPDPRLILRIGIGTASVPVTLDTGSPGLRVLASALDGGVTLTGTPMNYAYHDNNLVLNGVIGMAPITIAGKTTPPIPIMVITAACKYPSEGDECDSGTPVTGDLLGSEGIFGVSLRIYPNDDGVDSPVAQLPDHPAFLIHVPGADADAGLLVLGPASDLLAGAATVQLPPEDAGAGAPYPSWNDRGIPSLVQDETSNASYPMPASLDTGNPGPYIEWPVQAGSPATGDCISVTVGTLSPKPIGFYTFGEGSNPYTVDVEISDAGFMNLGVTPFLYYDVVFVPWSGMVGLRRH